MRFFITGRNGFIARSIARQCPTVEFSDRGDNVYQKLVDFQPDYIFHLAAELAVESEMFCTNVMMTVDILEYCREHPVKKCVIFGSSSEYGSETTSPRKETDPLNPKTIYEGTKCAATLLAQAWSNTYRIPVTVIRPFTVYGPGEKPNKLTQVLKRCLRDREVLKLGPGVHDYIYIDDFVEAVFKVTMFKEPGSFNIVNIGQGIQVSNENFVRAAQRATGKKISVELMDSKKVYDSECWVCDTTLLAGKYGFEPKFTLEDGLRVTLSSN
jgi:nucleoside-diphosphate-sugar epimerase